MNPHCDLPSIVQEGLTHPYFIETGPSTLKGLFLLAERYSKMMVEYLGNRKV